MAIKEKKLKYKTKLLADRFVAALSPWPGVECITLNEAARSDTLDPYYAFILDIFYSGPIPPAAERRAHYGEASAFETSSRGDKDRFLIGELPVRLEYKSTQKIDELVSYTDTKLDSLWFIRDSGTYGFYRLAHGEILFSRNTWIRDIREQLANLDAEFWRQTRDAHQSKMEHFLNDLGAALFQRDNFHYLISSALFIKTACLTLFCINHRFEPSHRGYYKQVIELPILPESFPAQLETFLSGESEVTQERKYSLAQVIAREIISL
jgi:hypothetical protein